MPIEMYYVKAEFKGIPVYGTCKLKCGTGVLSKTNDQKNKLKCGTGVLQREMRLKHCATFSAETKRKCKNCSADLVINVINRISAEKLETMPQRLFCRKGKQRQRLIRRRGGGHPVHLYSSLIPLILLSRQPCFRSKKHRFAEGSRNS